MLKKLAVIGVGNLLMRDEGVGVHVVRRLEREGVPGGATLLDAGVAILDIIGDVDNCDRVLVIDATEGGGETGAVYRYRLEDLPTDDFRNCYLASAHQIGLAEAIEMSRLAGPVPRDITVIGVQPGDTDYGTELSPALEAEMEKILRVVREEISRMME